LIYSGLEITIIITYHLLFYLLRKKDSWTVKEKLLSSSEIEKITAHGQASACQNKCHLLGAITRQEAQDLSVGF